MLLKSELLSLRDKADELARETVFDFEAAAQIASELFDSKDSALRWAANDVYSIVTLQADTSMARNSFEVLRVRLRRTIEIWS